MICEDLILLFIIWCCVPSPQSKSQTSDDCESLSAREETFLVKVGTPELVARKVMFTYINIVVFLSFKIKTLMIGSFEADKARFWEKQKINILIKQKLWVVFMIFNITLFEKQILKLP